MEDNLSFWQKSCSELQETINELKDENRKLESTCNKLNNQLLEMNKISQENEIMRKYYKLDQEPSIDVQAKVIADLRLHDMRYEILKEKLDECQRQLSWEKWNALRLSLPVYNSIVR